MGLWNHYILTDERPVTLDEIEAGLKAYNPNFSIDGNLIVLNDDRTDGDLIMGQISIEISSNPEELTDWETLEYFISRKRKNRAVLMEALNSVKGIVTVQLTNTGIWWKWEPKRTLAILQSWLMHNRSGILYVEGNEYYNLSGRIA